MMTNIFLSFLRISVSTSLIVAVLILSAPYLNKRYAAKWKYWIWVILALRLLIPFSGTEGSIDIFSRIKNQFVPKYEEGRATDLPEQTAPSQPIVIEIPEQMATPISMPFPEKNVSITPLDIVAFIWMLGSFTFLSVHLISYFLYKRQVRKNGTPIEEERILQQISGLRQELHIRHTIYAVKFPEAASPMITGFLKPVLILPDEHYASQELFFVLKHELVHWKRKDLYKKLLFITVNAIHWFNPFIWLMQKEAVVDMELSCDERVTQGADYAMRKAYTETLLSALHKKCVRKTVLSTQFYGGVKIMKKRFQNILKSTGKKNGIIILVCAAVLTAGLGTLIGYSVPKVRAEEESSNKAVLTDGQTDDNLSNGQKSNSPANGQDGNALANRQDDSNPANRQNGNTLVDRQVDVNSTNSENGNTLANGQGENAHDDSANNLPGESQPVIEIPQNGQIYGYISKFENGAVTIDWQLWVTSEDENWKPEYNDAAGFEVVDVPGEDIILSLNEGCTYSILENHHTPRIGLDGKEFENYLPEMQYPVLWIFQLENGEITDISEQYLP